MKKQGQIILPKYIELGTYKQANKRRIKFKENSPKHVKLFETFYSIVTIEKWAKN
jgi:hypothetical protein